MSITPNTRDLLAAIRDLLAVPDAAQEADQHRAEHLLGVRAAVLRGFITGTLGTAELTYDENVIREIRAITDRFPVTYEALDSADGGVA